MLVLRMHGTYVASFVWTSTENEWNAQNESWSQEFGPSITRVLIIYHVELKQSTAIEQERFDRLSLSPALRNIRLLLAL